MKTSLVLFAKPPIRGQVKTRLAASLGEVTAYHAYCLFLKWHIETINTIQESHASDFSTFIYTPTGPALNLSKAKKLFTSIGKPVNTKFVSQSAGSLGDKMEDAFARSLKSHDFCIIWGADVPLITPDHFFSARKQAPKTCIIPATDGGYSLISAAKENFKPGIMKNVPWSSEHTLEFQLRQLENKQVPFTTLPAVPDLDNDRDLAANILYMNSHSNDIYQKRASELAALLDSLNTDQTP